MDELLRYRDEIDAIDSQIYELFEKRLDIACHVADYKIKNDRDVFDPVREKEKLEKIADKATDPFMAQGMKELFSQIMSISKKRQYQILAEAGKIWQSDHQSVKDFDFTDAKIVYQGVEGAYSQLAAISFFGQNGHMTHVKSWRDAMEALRQQRADYAVLPIENSTAGSIVENYDLILEFDVSIIGEQIVEIDHALLGIPGAKCSDIHTVYSHPQAIMQCDGFFRRHPEYKAVSLTNTAVSARKVYEDGDPSQAAIAGEVNAKLYDLCILEKKIQDEKENKTRFIIVTKRRVFKEDANSITVCYELPNQKGSLYQSLSHFIFNGLNMTRIESRPIPHKPWQYRFFVDFTGNLSDDAVINALWGLAEETEELKVLGNYYVRSTIE